MNSRYWQLYVWFLGLVVIVMVVAYGLIHLPDMVATFAPYRWLIFSLVALIASPFLFARIRNALTVIKHGDVVVIRRGGGKLYHASAIHHAAIHGHTKLLTESAGTTTIAEEESARKPLAPQIAAPSRLPESMMMIDVMKSWPLSLDNLFLAYGKGRKPIACSLEHFMHVAHDAPTGQGKTALFYAEIIMLLKLGVRVVLANPHFVPVGKKGEDWRPIGRAIEAQGSIELSPHARIPGLIRKPEHIASVLKWLVETEINRRFTMMAQGNYDYAPIYLFIDEWPHVVRKCPEAADYQVEVLQRGRAVEICVDTNSQGFLLNDVDLKGSARENFNTAYHMGGSPYSGAKLLDMPLKDFNALLRMEQVPLGKGIAMLRNNAAAPQAELVRLPYAENNYAYYMLGRADEWALPEFRGGSTASGAGSVPEASQEVDGSEIDDLPPDTLKKALRSIGKRVKNGEDINEIRRSLGITRGRALQEFNAALTCAEEERQ